MKKIFLILFIIISNLSFSQSTRYTSVDTNDICSYFTGDLFSSSKLDSILFDKINKYRISKGLKSIKYDTSAVKASNHHSVYQFGICNVSHSEDTLKRPGDRYKKFGGKTSLVSEVCTGATAGNIKDSDPMFFDKLTDNILNSWKKSAPHNAILLDKSAVQGGGSIVFKLREQGMKTWKNTLAFSTFIIL